MHKNSSSLGCSPTSVHVAASLPLHSIQNATLIVNLSIHAIHNFDVHLALLTQFAKFLKDVL